MNRRRPGNAPKPLTVRQAEQMHAKLDAWRLAVELRDTLRARNRWAEERWDEAILEQRDASRFSAECEPKPGALLASLLVGLGPDELERRKREDLEILQEDLNAFLACLAQSGPTDEVLERFGIPPNDEGRSRFVRSARRIRVLQRNLARERAAAVLARLRGTPPRFGPWDRHRAQESAIHEACNLLEMEQSIPRQPRRANFSCVMAVERARALWDDCDDTRAEPQVGWRELLETVADQIAALNENPTVTELARGPRERARMMLAMLLHGPDAFATIRRRDVAEKKRRDAQNADRS